MRVFDRVGRSTIFPKQRCKNNRGHGFKVIGRSIGAGDEIKSELIA